MRYILQNRWKIRKVGDESKLVYYGLRNWPKNKRQLIPLNSEEVELIKRLDKPTELSVEEKTILDKFIAEKIIVPHSEFRPDSTRDNYQMCTKCIANDYVIPGLEFNEDGVCAFCQCYENEKPDRTTSLLTIDEDELVENIKKRRHASRFDVMVFFTGGKDSSYLVWHLSKNLKLRVLAACWDMPFTNDSSRRNTKKLLESLPEVELIQWTLPVRMFEEAIKKQYETLGLFCLCPAPAYPLFYPIAKMYNIPYVMWGMEDVQASVIEYIFPVPSKKCTSEREQTIQVLKARAMPNDLLEPVTWRSEVHNYHASLQKIFEPLYAPLQKILEEAEKDKEMEIPIIKRLRTKESYGTWQSLIDLLEKEIGWEMPKNQKNQLHTSCMIEQVKDYTQFLRFKNMESVFFPQAMVELSAAVVFGHLSREEALEQFKELGFFEPPKMYEFLLNKIRNGN
ncbi:hypothetical protein SAMN04488516_102224 [Desulfonauticus submarinus]|uniref:Uncharacterized protein n=1 Tax=Desulfonauticus submarinus TaxID=206665 RepID=A0A1H0BMD9_9BACT|nr:hypothetical protein [Desulfonauticus submarinus]SDN46804.1 hypothetical protein SAMN04488516_102224 [Desulfonauticus submarinus]